MKNITSGDFMNIKENLFKMQDLGYREFHSRLMPDIPKEKIIGVRVPMLRDFSKKLYKSGEYFEFLSRLPHKYYEENNLHAFIIEQIKDFDEAISYANAFLPYVDNWATCDCFRPKVFAKNKDKLLGEIRIWLKSDKTYTVRYAIGMLMIHFLGDNFKKEYMRYVLDIKSDEYYINMMRAWYFATAFDKQKEITISVLENKLLDEWTHNKAIQKICESRITTPNEREYVKTLKIKR